MNYYLLKDIQTGDADGIIVAPDSMTRDEIDSIILTAQAEYYDDKYPEYNGPWEAIKAALNAYGLSLTWHDSTTDIYH